MDNNCNLNTDCSKAGIHAQTAAQYNACKVQQQAPEAIDGCEYTFVLHNLYYLSHYTDYYYDRAQGNANGRDVNQSITLIHATGLDVLGSA